MKRSAIATVIIAIAAFLLATACYARKTVSWGAPGEFDIRLMHVDIGIPRWLEVNWYRIEGAAPPISETYLPDASLYPPGWHVHSAALIATLIFSLFCGIVFTSALKLLESPHRQIPYFIHFGISILIGSLLPTEPAWIGLILVCGIIPLSVFSASALGNSYSYGCIAGIATAPLIWASTRIADLFSNDPLVHDCPEMEEFVVGSIIALVSAGIAGFATRLRRFRGPRKTTVATAA
jgi:hypothetical protein